MSHEYFICHLAASQIYLMTPWTAGKPLILKDYTACYAIYYEKEKKTKNTTITLMTAWARLHESTLSSVGCYGWHNRATSIYDMMCSSFWLDIFRVNVKSSFRQLILFFPLLFQVKWGNCAKPCTNWSNCMKSEPALPRESLYLLNENSLFCFAFVQMSFLCIKTKSSSRMTTTL